MLNLAKKSKEKSIIWLRKKHTQNLPIKHTKKSKQRSMSNKNKNLDLNDLRHKMVFSPDVRR